jgi:hypothetical protein
MTLVQISTAILGCIVLIGITYYLTGWQKVKECLLMWVSRKYWTNYNFVEASSYLSKMAIIVSQVLFYATVWWFYLITLISSLALIWASNKKLLPTMILFNTAWVAVSCFVLARTFI